jgi:hypothetical protein
VLYVSLCGVEGGGTWEYLQHDLLVKEERDDCAVMATRLAAMVSGACVYRMRRRACVV